MKGYKAIELAPNYRVTKCAEWEIDGNKGGIQSSKLSKAELLSLIKSSLFLQGIFEYAAFITSRLNKWRAIKLSNTRVWSLQFISNLNVWPPTLEPPYWVMRPRGDARVDFYSPSPLTTH